MTRATAVTYLASRFTDLQDLTALTPTDDGAGYGPVIDDALLTLGVDYDTLPTAEVLGTPIQAFRRILDFFALDTFAKRLLATVTLNVSTTAVSEALSNRLKQVQADRDLAASTASRLGYNLTAKSGASLSEIALDIYEPLEPGVLQY